MKDRTTILFLFIGMLLFSSFSWGEDKVFTNEDLEKYQGKNNPPDSVVPRETISYSELMRRSGSKLQPVCTDEVKASLKAVGGGCEEWREGERPYTGKQTPPMPKLEDKHKPILSESEEVAVSIAGCQTLQEALAGKAGNTDAIITVRRRGRTIEEICDTLGQGCKSCGEAPRQMGNNQRH